MEKKEIATIQIVALLVRLARINNSIGSYCGRINKPKGIIIKTTTGPLYIPKQLLARYTSQEDSVTDSELLELAEAIKIS